jgi:hypothetical protein
MIVVLVSSAANPGQIQFSFEGGKPADAVNMMEAVSRDLRAKMNGAPQPGVPGAPIIKPPPPRQPNVKETVTFDSDGKLTSTPKTSAPQDEPPPPGPEGTIGYGVAGEGQSPPPEVEQ